MKCANALATFAREAPGLAPGDRYARALHVAAALPGVQGAALLFPTDAPLLAGTLAPLPPSLLATVADAYVPVPVGEGVFAMPVRGATDVLAALALAVLAPHAAEGEIALTSLAGILSSAAVLDAVEAMLQRSEAQSRAIVETTVDAVVTIDEERRILSFNGAAERIFGYRERDVLGRNVSLLMPEPYKAEHDGYVERYLATGVPHIIGLGREVTGLRQNGEVFPMELAVSEVVLPEQRLFTGIVRDISDRRQLEQEVLRISDMERRRIGQDLHDGLGQMLTGIGLITGGLARRARQEAPALADDLDEIVGLVREADALARGLARGLVPVDLEQGGLVGALERMVEGVRRMFDVTVRLHVQGSQPLDDPTVAMHLYRIAQEAVSNAARHSGASRISVLLVRGAEQVRLRIRDDGRGLPPDLAQRPHSGMGLRIMHYRARIVGASLEVTGAPEGGTVILCTYRRDGQTPARSLTGQLSDLP